MRNTEVLKETTIGFCESRTLPGRPCKGTLLRWARSGLAIVDSSQRVTLEWCRRGRESVTSLEAIERFHKRINGELEPGKALVK